MSNKKKIKELEERINHLEKQAGESSFSCDDDSVGGKRFNYYKHKDEHTLYTWRSASETFYQNKKNRKELSAQEEYQQHQTLSQIKSERDKETGGKGWDVQIELLVSEIEESAHDDSDKPKKWLIYKSLIDRSNFAYMQYLEGNISKEEYYAQIKKGREEQKGKIIPYIVLSETLSGPFEGE